MVGGQLHQHESGFECLHKQNWQLSGIFSQPFFSPFLFFFFRIGKGESRDETKPISSILKKNQAHIIHAQATFKGEIKPTFYMLKVINHFQGNG